MPAFLVIHLSNYPLEQLREEQGCPAHAVLVEASNHGDAIKEAVDCFEQFGPVGMCVALDAGKISTEERNLGEVFEQTEDIITDSGNLYPRVVKKNGQLVEPQPPDPVPVPDSSG